jgi:hypothetical protein
MNAISTQINIEYREFNIYLSEVYENGNAFPA